MNKIYCPICRVNTNHQELHTETIHETDNDDMSWYNKYSIIRCDGCDNIQFELEYGDNQLIEINPETGELDCYPIYQYYPSYIDGHKYLQNTHYIPSKINNIYNETLDAIKNKNYILSGVGLRAVIEAICINEGIKGRNLQAKIDSLAKNNHISINEATMLHGIRFLGNDSIHNIEVPHKEQILVALNIVEHLINSLYILKNEADSILDTIIHKTYDSFIRIFKRKFNTLKNGEEKNIKEILGNEYRRTEETLLPTFERDLIRDINAGKLPNVHIGKIENTKQYFKKIESPTL